MKPDPFKIDYSISEFCTTYSGEQGNCIRILNCPELRTMINVIRSDSTRNDLKDAIKKSICAYQNSIPMVCCKILSAPVSDSNSFSIKSKTVGTPITFSGLLPNSQSCGKALLADRIVGGDDAEFGTWPWIALLAGRTSKIFIV